MYFYVLSVNILFSYHIGLTSSIARVSWWQEHLDALVSYDIPINGSDHCFPQNWSALLKKNVKFHNSMMDKMHDNYYGFLKKS